ncbi:hypothetical protein EBZ39_01585 [bacterium]|nr:hypothetical protein [bacterium]
MAETKKYKYLNKDMLDKINYISREVMKYNRSLPQELIDSLPEDTHFGVTFAMLHEHIAGKPAEPHVRCIIYGGPDVPERMILDMAMDLYEMLPEIEIPATPEPDNSEPEVAVGN